MVIAEYDAALAELQNRGEALAQELRAILERDPKLKIHSVSWRLKDRESLAKKLARPDRSYADLWMITDLIGIRVITYFADAVDRVGELVEQHLPVDFAHSTDKRRREATEFGYRSLHYVCRLGAPLPERAACEIQVRTVLEHAWAEIEHDLGYKATEEIPIPVRRRLSRLAGLLELADEEFGAIRDELDRYARALPERIASASVPLDRFSLIALLEQPDVAAIDQAIAAELGYPLSTDAFFPDYLLRLLASAGVRTTEDAQRGLNAEVITAMAAPYFALAAELWELSPARLQRIPRGYALFFLAHARVLHTSTLRLEKIERLARVYRELDYPEDPKAAHDVATRLVDALSS
jgi:ppGpp synthetase/RelA/SpoT-type nucleotidyltranferase